MHNKALLSDKFATERGVERLLLDYFLKYRLPASETIETFKQHS